MNRPASLPVAGPLTLAALIFVAALTRVIPHPPNFSPIEAVALFGGAYFAKRHGALLVPLAAMFLSDLVLGLLNGGIYWSYFGSAGYILVYACIALSSVLGFGLRGKVSGGRVVAAAQRGQRFQRSGKVTSTSPRSSRTSGRLSPVTPWWSPSTPVTNGPPRPSIVNAPATCRGSPVAT